MKLSFISLAAAAALLAGTSAVVFAQESAQPELKIAQPGTIHAAPAKRLHPSGTRSGSEAYGYEPAQSGDVYPYNVTPLTAPFGRS